MSDLKEVKKGGISVETNHIFPIIKKWLYSEKDIFLREIVSNAADAVTKRKRLVSLGNAEEPTEPYRIDVTVDREAGTLTVSDNGIGMSAEELEKYLCSIALSGALDFIQKYENENDASSSGIIGHFGLGFYSAFMVSDRVKVESRSFDGSPAVQWDCNDAGEYELSAGDREGCGTDVIMYIAENEKEYLDINKIRTILNRYCAFMPVEIYLSDGSDENNDNSDNDEKGKESEPINDTTPLWLKNPSEWTEEEYKDFYHKVFSDLHDPLFWIHLNVDYPLNFNGILYFPRIANEYESIEGQVKLYYNQVFVSDNIKEILPDYLLMLKGVLDCPELPLNVSRSYLQTNSYVQKLSAHIVKKVADKLNSMLSTDREEYQRVFEDIRTFIEYACLRDRKFYDKVKDSVMLHITDGSYMTVNEYLEAAKETNENKIYYTTDRALQSQYISMLESEGIKVALMEHMIDTQYAAMCEELSDNGVKYLRVDAELADALKGDGESSENEKLRELFKKVSGNNELTVSFCPLKDEKVPALLSIPEESRRMEEMMRLYRIKTSGDGGESLMPTAMTLTLNTNAALTEKLSYLCDTDEKKAEKIASYVYKLSLLSQKKLSPDEMNAFMAESFELLGSL